MNRDAFSDEILMAYADGELPVGQAAAVERAARQDAAIEARIEMFRVSKRLLRDAYDPALGRPVPHRLRKTVDALADGAETARRAPARADIRRRARLVLALAASLILAVVLGAGWWLGRYAVPHNGRPFALAAVLPAASAAVLDRVPSGELGDARVRGSRVQMLMLASYDADGRLCREFEVQRRAGNRRLRALACRSNGRWRMQALADTASDAAPSKDYVPASGGGDLSTLFDLGQPLTADQERRALAGHSGQS